jgi:hypothetical protein
MDAAHDDSEWKKTAFLKIDVVKSSSVLLYVQYM